MTRKGWGVSNASSIQLLQALSPPARHRRTTRAPGGRSGPGSLPGARLKHTGTSRLRKKSRAPGRSFLFSFTWVQGTQRQLSSELAGRRLAGARALSPYRPRRPLTDARIHVPAAQCAARGRVKQPQTPARHRRQRAALRTATHITPNVLHSHSPPLPSSPTQTPHPRAPIQPRPLHQPHRPNPSTPRVLAPRVWARVQLASNPHLWPSAGVAGGIQPIHHATRQPLRGKGLQSQAGTARQLAHMPAAQAGT